MKKYIALSLIILVGVVFYFNQHQATSSFEIIQNSKNTNNQFNSHKRSLPETIINAIKNKNQPDDGIRRVGSNKPDSDTSACTGITKSDKDMIITNFAGYLLKYPCTVNQNGEYHIEYNPDNTILSQRYTLYIGTVLGQGNDSIWWNGKYDNDNTQGFYIRLSSDGNEVLFDQFKARIKSAKLVKEELNKKYIIYSNENHVFATRINNSNQKEDFPILSCDRYGNVDPDELFSPFHNIGNKSQCSLIWRLTTDIKVTVIRYKSKYASNFLEIYDQLNKGLKEIIIETPNHQLKPTEK